MIKKVLTKNKDSKMSLLNFNFFMIYIVSVNVSIASKSPELT